MNAPATFTDLLNIERHKVKPDALGVDECGLGCIVEVAADKNALLEALAEYGYRLFLEGEDYEAAITLMSIEAKKTVIHKIRYEVKSKQGYVPPPEEK